MQYQIPQTINPKKIFLINFSELQERMDPLFYREHFDFNNFCKLSSIAKISGGKRIPLGKGYSITPTPFLYLRVADIQEDGSVDFSKLKYIDEDTYCQLKRYEILNGDLAVSIAGTIGKVVVVKGVPENAHVILTENCAKIILRDDEVLTEYLQLVLMMPILQQQIALNYIQTTIPKLGLDRVCRLMLPPIPSISTQQQIIAYYNSEFAKKTQKDKRAEVILNTIDNYVLNELGLHFPETKAQTLQDRIFSVPFSKVIGGRLDPKSVLFLGEKTRSTIYENIQLKQIAQIEKGVTITSDEVNKDGQFPVIAGGKASPYNHDRYNYEGNVITVSASGAYSGYVWYHRDPIFASDCSVIYSKSGDFLTEYIFVVLKAQQSHIYLLQQGAGQPHVYPDDLEKLWIPMVQLSKQQEIVDHITAIRKQAKALQEEGKDILERAKKEVERMIIGE